MNRGYALVGENLLEFVSLCKETLSLQNSLTLIASHQGVLTLDNFGYIRPFFSYSFPPAPPSDIDDIISQSHVSFEESGESGQEAIDREEEAFITIAQKLLLNTQTIT